MRAVPRPHFRRDRGERARAADPWWLLVVLWLVAAAFAGATLLDGIQPHDEGLMLQAAERVASGELPYRDFWWSYGPGQPLTLGALTELLGSSLLTWRVVRVALDATIALLAFLLARRAAPRGWSLVAWAGSAGAIAFPAGPGPNPTALVIGLGAILLARRAPLAAGALAGVAALFRPELGVAAALGVALAADRGAAPRALISAAATGVLLWLPFFVAAPGELLDQVVGFLGIQDLQRLPFPLAYDGPLDPNKLLEFYGPLLLLAGLALWTARAIVARAPRDDWALAPLALVGALYLLGRSDEFHLAPLAVVLPPMLAVAVAGASSTGWRVALGLALALVAMQGVERQLALFVHPTGDRELAIPAADGVRVPGRDATAIEQLASAIDASVPRGQPIFVANPRHDLVRVGDPLLYVLLARPNPTHYDVMQPGVVTTAPVQREIVAALRQARPARVVRWLAPTASAREPNGAGESSGVRILDDYLRASYRPIARFGDYELLAPR